MIGTLGFALGVAASPLPILGVLIALVGVSGRRNGVAFLLGWVAGVTGVVVGVYLAVHDADLSRRTASTKMIQTAFAPPHGR